VQLTSCLSFHKLVNMFRSLKNKKDSKKDDKKDSKKEKSSSSSKPTSNSSATPSKSSPSTVNGPTLVVEGSKVEWKSTTPIDKGSSSIILRGVWKNTDVAVKVIQPEGTKQFGDTEKKVLSELRHPYVIPYYGSGVVNNRTCLVIKYGEHGTLAKRLADEKFDMDWNLRLKIAKQIAEGMAYVHVKGYIHGDLKSHNILLTDEAANMSVNIFDFETARKVDDVSTKVRIPTLRWCAPEAMQSKQISIKTDVYSYGMILYELFSRKMPYAEDDDTVALKKIENGVKPKLENCPRAWADLIAKCLSTKPGLRPTFEEIKEELSTMNIQEKKSMD